MALSRKYIEFDITGDNLTVGTPVGYEADFSADPLFKEIRSSISTFNALDENQANKIYYNINGESTWNLFPYGQEGVTFNDSYKIRVETTSIDTGYILIESSGVLNKVRSDFDSIISSSNIFSANVSSDVLGIEVNNKNRECFILNDDSIIVTNYDSNDLKKRKIPLLNDQVFAISLDSAKETFWQINSDSVYLRNLFGEKLLDIVIPEINIGINSSSSFIANKCLIKKLNKYNGNICFAAKDISDTCYIYECDRNGYLYSAQSSNNIKSICALDEKSWYVTFENSGWIGLFTRGTLIENFIPTSFSEVSQIELASGFFFIPPYKETYKYLIVLDRINNTLTKFYLYNNDTSYSIYWTYAMPEPLYAESSYITVREDGYIIYTNSYNSYLISDMGNSAAISQSLPISDGNSIFTAIIKNNETSYVRIRSVSGGEIGESSISSSSTDSLSSRSSRSSVSSQSSSSSSQSGKVFYRISAGTPVPNPDPSGDYQAYGTCNSKTRYKKKGDSWYLTYRSIGTVWRISKSSSCLLQTNYYGKTSTDPVGTYTNVGSLYTGSAIVGYVASSSSSSGSVSSSSSVILSRSSLSSESSSSESAQSASSKSLSTKSLSSASSSSTSSSSSIISRSSESSSSKSSKSLSSYSSESSIEIHSSSSVSWSWSSSSSSSLNDGIWDWKIVGPQGSWQNIVSNSDGTKFAAADYTYDPSSGSSPGHIWTVEYSGSEWKWEPWIPRVQGYVYGYDPIGWHPSSSWVFPCGLACSSDGNKLFGMVQNGLNVYSSVDSGVNWSNASVTGVVGDLGWAIACSSDGTKLVTSIQTWAGDYIFYIYTSNNSGATWTRQIEKYFTAIASSSDGSKLAALSPSDYIYTSNDSGVAWTQQIGSVTSNTDITSSDNGSKLAACDGSYVYTSNDSGITWTTHITPVGPNRISSSADGTVIAAVSSANIIISTDSGSNWVTQPSLGNYMNIAVSANGNRIAAVSQTQYIYIGTRP